MRIRDGYKSSFGKFGMTTSRAGGLDALQAVAQDLRDATLAQMELRELPNNGLVCAAAITLVELQTKEQAMTTSTAEMAERLADLQSREAALEAAQATLEARLQQLHSDEQARPQLC